MVDSRLSKLLTIVKSLVQVTQEKVNLFNISNAQPDVDPIVFFFFVI